MKKSLGLVLLTTFFIGALAAWTYLEQEDRHRRETEKLKTTIERLSSPRPVAKLTVTTIELVGLSTDGKEHAPMVSTVIGLEACLPDGDTPATPGTTYELVTTSEGELKLVQARPTSE